MADFGVVNATVNVQAVAGATEYIAMMDFAPIPDSADPLQYTTQLVTVAEVPGDVVVSKSGAPTVSGSLYVRVYAKEGNIQGHLSNEVVKAYDFRLPAPVISLVG